MDDEPYTIINYYAIIAGFLINLSLGIGILYFNIAIPFGIIFILMASLFFWILIYMIISDYKNQSTKVK